MGSTITCKKCQKTRKTNTTKGGNLRVPQSWKRHNEEIWCEECWRNAFKLRAITFPVAGIIDGEWPELRKSLRDSWGRSTALANWAVSELAKADVQRSPSDVKLPPRPKVNLYSLWQSHHQRDAWDGAAVAANCILHSVELKYQAKRYDMIWTGKSSLPSFRYPYPYPVHNANWKAIFEEFTGTDGHKSRVPTVYFPLGGRNWTLRLAGGANRIRQLRAFAKIENGEAVQCELAIYRQRTFSGGNGVVESNGAAGSKVRTRIMVKLVAWFPRDEAEREAKGTLNVFTTNNSFLVALIDGDTQPWRLHADDVRGVIKQHTKLRQRLADDTKAEQRRPPRQKARYLEMLEKKCERCNNRIGTFIKEAASWLVNYAKRRKVEALVLDDTKHGYFPSFPWERFRSQVAEKCGDARIAFVNASESVLKTENSEESSEA